MEDKDRREGKSRITRDYVMHWDLIQETGVQSVDDYLYCLMNILRIHLGDDLRAAFLIGSYAHGWQVSDSDIDICFVFRDGVDRFREVWSIVEHLQLLLGHKVDPMYYGPEAPLYDLTLKMDSLTPILRLAMKEHSLHLLGDDVRPSIVLSSEDEVLADSIRPVLNGIRMAHNKPTDGHSPLDMPIVYPLTDPSPQTEDRGFGDERAVEIRSLNIARGLTSLSTGTFLFHKREIADAFTRTVGGPWVEIVTAASAARFGHVSEAERRQAWLEACRNMTAFENHFLECLRDKGLALPTDIVGFEGIREDKE